jgi:hypothetical protein
MAVESALRLSPEPATAPAAAVVAQAAAAAAAAGASGDTVEQATQKGQAAAADAMQGAAPSASSGPLSQLVKYIPTETIALYIAVLGALGDIKAPPHKEISDADFSSRWIWMYVLLVATLVLTLGLSYRSQKDTAPQAKFKLPIFEICAAGVAFLIWALSLPSTPLRDIGGYDYNAWNTVIILGGTVIVATAAYVLGKTVKWQKVVEA